MSTSNTPTPTWEELLGSNNWSGLLEPPPMNLELRKFILKCGNFAEATYDAFESDPNIPHSGNRLYDPNTLFSEVFLEKGDDYKAVSFLYAASGVESLRTLFPQPTAPSDDTLDRISHWMGYVAVTKEKVNDRREIYIAWRGTSTSSEWESNAVGLPLEPINPLITSKTDPSDGEPKVHKGFLSIYTSISGGSSYVRSSAKDQLWTEIKKLKKEYADEKLSIVVTGHSLGGSLATLSAFDLVANGTGDIPVTVVAFSCPRVGNEDFNMTVKRHRNLKILHVRASEDTVPKVPTLSYVPIHTTELKVDVMKSPDLKKSLLNNPTNMHNLEVLLHVVAGWNGPKNEFNLAVIRDLALVNKWTGLLDGKHGIPESWWVDRKKKGMEYNNRTGKWVKKV